MDWIVDFFRRLFGLETRLEEPESFPVQPGIGEDDEQLDELGARICELIEDQGLFGLETRLEEPESFPVQPGIGEDDVAQEGQMNIEWSHRRFGQSSESTIAEQLDERGARICYLLEDQGQPPGVKVPAETRIPVGRYELVLRTDSPKFAHYFDRWPEWFRGMPLFVDVEGDGEGFEILSFLYVMAHPGTDDDDSAGCPLTCGAYELTTEGHYRCKPGTSRSAFKTLCMAFYQQLERGNRLFTTVSEDFEL